ncbi:MAG: TraB/GumN family protein [gamma proteobacterium symbiont of Bathyaustriella thionipta]|nr:TraB/GumN family protein [gamma proteobacterium symbiont of Bathyaustriella thionipta]MCU7949155.1 TraB/GumN family protein [gamma proteobacterium symbiont of Bathyaustriella thionipta]MCU7953365.1 TraB/GumN family protein [gamma proteobacterium symbiont of Bathyaustriella thionipta]MCU7955749.1 TraB/GumN family protein [gamma proteobacterium symbiont of Bathyaustriella thionipta]MCU7965918.1 TraB/GumN family protein [gamma proteobacterium symbiont of Bathyaustriella thionipta]
MITLLFSLQVSAQSSLWQVSKNGHTLYLGGTIHVLEKADYPLPKEFEDAFLKADTVVFETDIAQAKQPEFAQKMMQQMRYPEGKTLKDVLNKTTYQRLSRYFSDKMPMAQVDVFKPGMVVMILSAIELQRLGMVVAGVDEHFWFRAEKAAKNTDILETLDEQLAFLVAMGQGNENELIMNSLDELNEMGAIIDALKKAWRTGDQAVMNSIILQDMMAVYPDLYQKLLVTRNDNWLPKIEKMLQDKRIEFVLVGSLHLMGNDGLLQLLRNKGYQISYYLQSEK